MNIKKWLRTWLHSDPTSDSGIVGVAISPYASNDVLNDTQPTFRFSVYHADGGKVVEFRRENNNGTRAENNVYIISKDEDFGDRIAKILTMESLRR